MEIPDTCLQARMSTRVTRQRKPVEDLDPDFCPGAQNRKPRPSFTANPKKLRRSKTLESHQKRLPPSLNFIERAEYSIEDWRKKAEERKRALKRKQENASKQLEVRRKKLRTTIDYSCQDGYDNDGSQDVYEQYVKMLDEGCGSGKELDTSKLPNFVMGSGKGTPGGPPKFDFKTLWKYELPELSENDNIDKLRQSFPWEATKFVPNIEPEIMSMVACFSVGQTLDLKRIAKDSMNVEYNPDRFAPLIMRIRHPKTTALIFRTGRVVISGSKTEKDCVKAATKIVNIIQKVNYKVSVLNFNIQNISAKCNFDFRVRLNQLSKNKLFGNLTYEPEIFPGLEIALEYPRVKVGIFGTGSVVMSGAKSVQDLRLAIKTVYPLVRMYAP